MKKTDIMTIRLGNAEYPQGLSVYLGTRAPGTLHLLGNLGILEHEMLALFCSVRCPGRLIIETYDLARELREAGIAVVSGFHSPMERECLSILLRGKQPVVWCLARRLATRGIPREYAPALEEGRLLIISPFDEKVKRATEATALYRNECVAALAERVFVAYAAPGGKTESFCEQILQWGKPLLTFDVPDNAAILSLGAKPLRDADSIVEEDQDRSMFC